ncbi:MAG: hypothetical protein RL657_736 [Pseudomonadota bacterium]|jgi:hypothetical protein
MRTIKAVRRLIERDPLSHEAKVLSGLVTALESEREFSIKDLYTLQEKHFDMAIQVLNDWRLDRYYMGKAKVFDAAWYAQEIQSTAKA